MTRTLLVLRPEPGNAATAAAARGLGLNTVAAPLFHSEAVPWDAPTDPTAYAGLLAGSAALFRLGGAEILKLRGVPVHAVGEATAAAAREAGFAVRQVAGGGMQLLVSALPPGLYLRPAGEAHVALDLPEGVRVDTRVVYAARALPLPDKATAAMRGGAVVLLHSGEAARHLAQESHRLALDRSGVTLACLAPRIAEAAGTGWQAVEIAPERTDQALLALAAQMCQNL
ncbi:uroporphyrinogen-III synthase [Novosphingobium cyanobacteriorum]|uniref:Uroporphyrinogen-III synthase n=1 Tax=Novosphingobium cyanobacteriorum TaxID=3024215 RepID=A0ABT6CLP1_9SPHN|nr:uroporphyrinogen-III synthase [Novosphingobium cyanobacteriorum]MDF8334158.1 uroporphyrinogen-III synthase [Novosphingobium cyanobacteriorum]